MKNYVIKNDRTAAEMIDLHALSCCKLNDFEAFDRILFGENVQPDYNKFYVGDLIVNDDSNYGWYTVAVPFSNPTTMVEYQINHYVMWGVIGMLKIPYKPSELVEYNTGDYLPVIENTCWACEWNFTHLGNYFCEKCPIWFSQGLFRFMCESSGSKERTGLNEEDLDGYYKWDNFDNDEETFEENAIKLQMYPWHVETCTDDFDI